MYVSTAGIIVGLRTRGVIGSVRGLAVRTCIGPYVRRPAHLSVSDFLLLRLGEFARAARRDALDQLIAHAEGMWADGVVDLRYETSDLSRDLVEVFAYGTAVRLDLPREPSPPRPPLPPPGDKDAAAMAMPRKARIRA